MSEENKALVRRWLEEGWNQGQQHVIVEVFAKNAISHGMEEISPNANLRGPIVFWQSYRMFQRVFRGIRIIIEDQIAESDRVATRCTLRANYEKDIVVRKRVKRSITISMIIIVRIEKKKIVEAWNS